LPKSLATLHNIGVIMQWYLFKDSPPPPTQKVLEHS